MSRLSPGTLVVAVIAVLMAMTGAFAVRQFLEREAAVESVNVEVTPITVPVAVTQLEPGRRLRESDFATLTMTPENFAKSKYAKVAFISQVEQLIDRVIREELQAGMTLGPDDLYPEGTGPTVADQLPSGMRAVTVKVSGSGFVDGFATPGTVVDVLFRSEADDDEIPETTITALHGIEVLAVDTIPYPSSLPEPSPGGAAAPREDVRVTFAVLPTQATMLKALEDRGEISLALRSNVAAEEIVAEPSNQEAGHERHAQTLSSILEGAKIPLVAVATTELDEGRIVRAGDIRLIEAQHAELNDEATYSDVESLVGRILRTAITPGQPLTAALLYPEGVGPGVADRLAPGFRAVTVKMDEAALVDGFVSPGTHVDVFFRAEEVAGYPETTLRVINGLKVLAIEDRVSPGTDPSRDQSSQGLRVTLEVPLGEVGRLQALEGHGVMTLAVCASDERPIGEIARDLDATQQKLKAAQGKIAALQQSSQLDDSIRLSKEQSERLASLLAEIPELERRLKSLGDEQDAASSGASQTTLAEVLNLPEPPRSEQLEIYSGGSRQTLVFNPAGRTSSASRTASRAVDNTTKASNKKKPDPSPGPVKQASDPKDADIENVSVSTPGRKVSAVTPSHIRGIDELVADGRAFAREPSFAQVGTRLRSSNKEDSFIWAVADFGRGLVNGLSKATQPAQRVEIVRGGVKE